MPVIATILASKCKRTKKDRNSFHCDLQTSDILFHAYHTNCHLHTYCAWRFFSPYPPKMVCQKSSSFFFFSPCWMVLVYILCWRIHGKMTEYFMKTLCICCSTLLFPPAALVHFDNFLLYTSDVWLPPLSLTLCPLHQIVEFGYFCLVSSFAAIIRLDLCKPGAQLVLITAWSFSQKNLCTLEKCSVFFAPTHHLRPSNF